MILIFGCDGAWRTPRKLKVMAGALLLARSNKRIIPSDSRRLGQSSQHDEVACDNTSSAHKEWRIARFTTVAVVVASVKISVVCGVPWFTVATWGLIFGWFAVQSLLLLHRSDLSNREQEQVVALAESWRDPLSRTNVWYHYLFVVLHLPILGYPAYFAFKFTYPAIDQIYNMLCLFVAAAYFFIPVLTIEFIISWAEGRYFTDWIWIAIYMLFSPFFAWFGVAGLMGMKASQWAEYSSGFITLLMYGFDYFWRIVYFVLLISLIAFPF